jgi:hypothetical protein
MFNSMDAGKKPMEDFYDSYIVNAIIDAAIKLQQPKMGAGRHTNLAGWVFSYRETTLKDYDEAHFLIKEEKMP